MIVDTEGTDPHAAPAITGRSTVRAAGWVVVERWGTRVIALSSFIVFARVLPQDAFGLVAAASAVTAFAALLRDQGLAQALVQRDAVTKDHVSAAFWASFGIGAVFTAVTWAAAPLIASLLGDERMTPILQLLSLSFVVSGVATTPNALLRRELRFKTLAQRGLLAAVVANAAGIACALAGLGTLSLVVTALADTTISALFIWMVAPVRPGRFRWAAWIDLARFGWGVMGIHMVGFATQRGDDVIVSRMLGVTALSYYTVAYRLLRLLRDAVLQTITAVALPTFSRLRSDGDRMDAAARRAMELAATLCLPIAAAVAVLAEPLTVTAFGDRWLAAVPAMQVLAFVVTADILRTVNAQLLLVLGRSAGTFALRGAGAALILTGFVLGAQVGVTAVAAGLLVSTWLTVFLDVGYARRMGIRLPVIVYLGALARAFPATGVAAAAGWVGADVLEFAPARLVVGGVAFVLTYLVVLRLTANGLLRGLIEVVRHFRPARTGG